MPEDRTPRGDDATTSVREMRGPAGPEVQALARLDRDTEPGGEEAAIDFVEEVGRLVSGGGR
ncbi:MAG: hypothetical protein ACK2UH_08170, partial [Candidatus Promineifilaceae bacterium]